MKNDVKKEGAKDYQAQKKFVSEVLTSAKDGDLGVFDRLLKDFEIRHPGSTMSENLTQIRDAHKRTALHFGASSGKRKIVQFILDQAPEAIHWKDEDDNTPLHYAAKENEYAIVKLLVEQKANIKQANKNGKTALHDAAANGSVRTVKLLVDAGADLEVHTASGTPLHWAVSENRENVVDQLLVKKARVDATNSNGLTPLFLACLMRKTAIAEALIKAGASLEPTIMGGVSVVHMAAETGYADLMELFLQYKFDVTKKLLNQKTDAGANPLQLAAGMGHSNVIQIIQPLTEGVAAHEIDNVIAIEKDRAQKELEIAAKEAAAKELKNRNPTVGVPTVEEIVAPEAKDMSPENEQQAVREKEAGNKAFTSKDYKTAIAYYTKDIEINPTEPKLYSNRGAAYLALGETLKALLDVRIAQRLQPSWTKALFREGQCLEELGLYEDAANMFWEVLKLNPDDKAIKKRFHQCVKRGREEFLKSKNEQ